MHHDDDMRCSVVADDDQDDGCALKAMLSAKAERVNRYSLPHEPCKVDLHSTLKTVRGSHHHEKLRSRMQVTCDRENETRPDSPRSPHSLACSNF